MRKLLFICAMTLASTSMYAQVESDKDKDADNLYERAYSYQFKMVTNELPNVIPINNKCWEYVKNTTGCYQIGLKDGKNDGIKFLQEKKIKEEIVINLINKKIEAEL